MKRNKWVLTAAILVVSVIAFVIGLIVLPETLVVQITMGGQAGNRMPKVLGLLLPLILSGGFSVLYAKTEERKNLIVAMLGLLIYVPTFAINL